MPFLLTEVSTVRFWLHKPTVLQYCITQMSPYFCLFAEKESQVKEMPTAKRIFVLERSCKTLKMTRGPCRPEGWLSLLCSFSLVCIWRKETKYLPNCETRLCRMYYHNSAVPTRVVLLNGFHTNHFNLVMRVWFNFWFDLVSRVNLSTEFMLYHNFNGVFYEILFKQFFYEFK